MAVLRLFAAARIAAGTSRDILPGGTVGDVLDAAVERYGHDFGDVLDSCNVWVNGNPATRTTEIGDDDEIGVLPPVSGGATS